MPTRARLIFAASHDPARVPLDQMHGAVCEWLDDDHGSNVKAFSLVPLRRHGPAHWELGIGLMDDSLRVRLEEVQAHRWVRFGRDRVELTTLDVDDTISWAELETGGDACREISFLFRTPTLFRSGKLTNPLPWPSGVFGSLRSRWSVWAPDSVPEVDLDAAELEVIHLEGHTATERLEGRQWTGFVGDVTYRARTKDPLQLVALGRLARFAPYSGVGAYTTRGLGVVDLVGMR